MLVHKTVTIFYTLLFRTPRGSPMNRRIFFLIADIYPEGNCYRARQLRVRSAYTYFMNIHLLSAFLQAKHVRGPSYKPPCSVRVDANCPASLLHCTRGKNLQD